MEPEVLDRLKKQEVVMDEMLASMEKTRKYLLVMMWIGVATVVGPLIGLVVAVPLILNVFGGMYGDLL